MLLKSILLHPKTALKAKQQSIPNNHYVSLLVICKKSIHFFLPTNRFDLAVNGGGGVTLQFQRSPLKATTKTLHLPWNQITMIDPVVMMPYAAGTSGISWDQQDTSTRVRLFFNRNILDLSSFNVLVLIKARTS